MTTRRIVLIVIVLGVIAAVVIAFSSQTPQRPTGPNANGATGVPVSGGATALPTAEKDNAQVGPNDPQIFMLEPQDGSRLSSPLFLRIGIANLPIPPSYVKIHIAIDATCAQPGDTLPADDTQHVTLPLGTFDNSRFPLAVGQHRLCIQATSQDDVALDLPGLKRVIDLTIVP